MSDWQPIETAPKGKTVIVTDGEKRWFWNSNDHANDRELEYWLIDLGIDMGTPLYWFDTPPLPA